MPVPEVRTLRKFIFDHFFETSTAPVIEEVMQRFEISRGDAFAALKAVEADHHIVLVPGTQRILMAHPYSAITTPFLVKTGGRRYFTNCAWDTVSIHVMLGTDADVESYCHHCGEPIKLSIREGRTTRSSHPDPLIFLSVPVANWYDNLINTCSNNMVYISSRAHLEEWLARNPDLKGESLTVEKMAEVCQPLSKGRMELAYSRPPKEELNAYWDGLGLTSPFWDL